jgi:serine protease DegS
MKTRKLVTFLLQAVTVGLAAAFVLIVLRPDLLEGMRPVVEFRESGPKPLEQARQGNGELARTGAGPVSYADAVEHAGPSVVNVFTSKRVRQRPHPLLEDPLFQHFFGDVLPAPRERLETSLGSGVIVSPQGYVLTNNHVIEGADEILVALRDGRSTAAQVVGTDAETDLAVLKIALEEMPAITIGDSETLRVGDVVLAIGNPFGVGQTVTMGIVSGTGRNRLGLSTFENFIQTDAAINPGNSGGALITPYGELVGINTAIFSRSGGSQGVGFAIPVSLAKGVMTQIIEYGQVRRGWLGVEVQDITEELAESFDMKTTDGVLVAGVLRGGPADYAGLKPGDVITAISGERVNDTRDALDLIAQHLPGSTLTLEGLRKGERVELEVPVGQRPPPGR